MDFEAHRRIHEQADDHRDDQGEERERRLDLRDASADKPNRAERLESREPEGCDDRGVQWRISEDRLHRSALRRVHRDQEIRTDVRPIVRKELRARRRRANDREVREM